MLTNKTTIEVRYAETDQMGIVYHANYLIWMEIGRTKLIEELGFKYTEMEERGILAPVTDVQVTYQKPIKYGDKVTVETWIEEYNGLRTVYGYRIFSNENVLSVSGYTKHVCVKKETFKPISIRKLFPDWHEAYLRERKQSEKDGI